MKILNETVPSLYVDCLSTELPQEIGTHIEFLSRAFWLILRLFRLFLGCSWVVQVVLGLFRGVPSFSNDGQRHICEQETRENF